MSQRKVEAMQMSAPTYRQRILDVIIETSGEDGIAPLDDLEKTVLLSLLEGATKGPAIVGRSRPTVSVSDVTIKQDGQLTRSQAEANALMIAACWNDVPRLMLEIELLKRAAAELVARVESSSNGALVDHRKVNHEICARLKETFSLKE